MWPMLRILSTRELVNWVKLKRDRFNCAHMVQFSEKNGAEAGTDFLDHHYLFSKYLLFILLSSGLAVVVSNLCSSQSNAERLMQGTIAT